MLTKEQLELLSEIILEYQDDLRDRFDMLETDEESQELEEYCLEVQGLVTAMKASGCWASHPQGEV